MSVKRNFTVPMSTLLYEGNLILTAAEGETAFATKRLATTLLADARGLWTSLGGGGSSADADIADVHNLTVQERASFLDMLDLFGQLKEAAKKAFRGDEVKLSEQFKVGVNKPRKLSSILDRGAIRGSWPRTSARSRTRAAGWRVTRRRWTPRSPRSNNSIWSSTAG